MRVATYDLRLRRLLDFKLLNMPFFDDMIGLRGVMGGSDATDGCLAFFLAVLMISL